MKYLSIVLISLSLLLTGASYGSATTSGQTTKASVITGLTSMPLAFTGNQGQWDEQVLFRANVDGATMWFTRNGAYYQFTRRVPSLVDRNPSGFDNSVIPAKGCVEKHRKRHSEERSDVPILLSFNS